MALYVVDNKRFLYCTDETAQNAHMYEKIVISRCFTTHLILKFIIR